MAKGVVFSWGAEMTKGAADVVASARGDDSVTAEDMLRSLTFQQRLDQARAAREHALQAAGQDDLASAPPGKPWERQSPPPGEPHVPHPRRPARGAPTIFLPQAAAPHPAANAPAEGVVLEQPFAVQHAQGTQQFRLPKSGLVRSTIGFGLGLGLGLAVALMILAPTGSDPDRTVASAPATAPPPAGSGNGLVLTSVSNTAAQAVIDAAPVLPVSTAPQPISRPHDAPAIPKPDTPPVSASAEMPGLTPTVRWQDPIAPKAPLPEELPSLARTAEGVPRFADPAQLSALAADGLPAPQTNPARPPASAPAADGKLAHLSVQVLGAPALQQTALADIAGQLHQAGYPAPKVGAVDYKIRQTHVRFYHAADAAAAGELAARLGVEARDFSRNEASAPEGLIEVWVAAPQSQMAKGKSVSAASQAKPKVAAAKAATKKKPAAAKKATVSAEQQAADIAEAAAVKARLLLMLQGSISP